MEILLWTLARAARALRARQTWNERNSMDSHRIPSISLRGTPRAIWRQFQDPAPLGHDFFPSERGCAVRGHDPYVLHTGRVQCAAHKGHAHELHSPFRWGRNRDQVVQDPGIASKSPWGYPLGKWMESYGNPWNSFHSRFGARVARAQRALGSTEEFPFIQGGVGVHTRARLYAGARAHTRARLHS